MAHGDSNFKNTIETLFNGMDAFLSTKTVVGEAIHIGDTILLPLVNVTFGAGAGAFSKQSESSAGGGMGGKMTPAAVLVITNGSTRMINLNSNHGLDKILDMAPDFVSKVVPGSRNKRSNKTTINEDGADYTADIDKALKETVVTAAEIERED